MNELKKIEEELNVLVEQDRQNWSAFYLLLKKVEDEELWEFRYSSFTAWVKSFAEKNKVQESVLWNRKKAGKIYQEYYARKLAKKQEVNNIQSVDIAQDSLILIEKIARNNPDLIDELTDKAINKELKKKDLQEAYRIIKAKKRDVKKEREKILLDKNISEEEKEMSSDMIKDLRLGVMTAVDIVESLKNHTWLSEEKEVRKSFKYFYEQDKYKVFPEFPVYTGTTTKSRRIDALVCENLTEERWKLNLHAIEIKVSKSDLVNDTKYTEYAEFVDYLWLAVPEELTVIAKEIKPSGCGILVVKDKKVRVIESAKKLDSLRREECLSRLALKLL